MAVHAETWESHLDVLFLELDELFRLLRYFDDTAKVGYEICCSAAISKCIDFNVLLSKKCSTRSFGFLSPSLRSMCEELIILAFLGTVRRQDADDIVSSTMQYEVKVKLRTQKSFFARYRPQQIVLTEGNFTFDQEALRDELTAKWRSLGCDIPGKWSVCPSTRSLSRKIDLEAIYDYFFDFASATVHFSPQQLFRSGWGPIGQRCWFTAEHMSNYFYLIDRIYGAVLLVHFLIKIGPALKLSDEIYAVRDKLIEFLDNVSNWPEIVTFEEMNIKRPQDYHPLIAATLSHRLRQTLWPT
jgi:hypothetical protein